jgi:DUF1680 family protein
MSRVKIRIECEKPEACKLELRIPSWAHPKMIKNNGLAMSPSASGKRILLTPKEKGVSMCEIDLGGKLRLVPWPPVSSDAPINIPLLSKEKRSVAVFDGPLCLGLANDQPSIDLPWSVLVDADGHMLLDSQGRPQAIEPTSRTVKPLEPINSGWLAPDVKNPTRRRILFQFKIDPLAVD